MQTESEYVKLLEKAYSQLPEKKGDQGERFKFPEVSAFIEGNKTIFKNFLAIVEKVRRDPEDLAKYISKELGAPVSQEGGALVIQKRVKPELLQKKVNAFIEDLVLCSECRKPDTRIVVQEGIRFILCEECGARRVARK